MNSAIATMTSLKQPIEALRAMSFSVNLIALRKKNHLTQLALAQKAGISLMQIKNYEHDKSQPTLESIKKLASAFSISADELIFSGEEHVAGVDEELRTKLRQLQQLSEKDRETVVSLIDAYVKKARLEEMMQE